MNSSRVRAIEASLSRCRPVVASCSIRRASLLQSFVGKVLIPLLLGCLFLIAAAYRRLYCAYSSSLFSDACSALSIPSRKNLNNKKKHWFGHNHAKRHTYISASSVEPPHYNFFTYSHVQMMKRNWIITSLFSGIPIISTNVRNCTILKICH